MTAASQAMARSTVAALRQAPRPQLRLVHDIDARCAPEPASAPAYAKPEPVAPTIGILARTRTAINKTYAVAFIVVSYVAIGIVGPALFENVNVMRSQNAAVIKLQAAPLKPPVLAMPYNRITGDTK